MNGIIVGIGMVLFWLSGFAAGVAALFVASCLNVCKREMPRCTGNECINEKGDL